MQFHAMERIAIFIDGSNLYHDLKNLLGRTDIDFALFGKKLCGDRRLVRIYYYNAVIDQNIEPERYKDQQRFFARLDHTEYLEKRLGRLKYKDTAPIQEKGVDVKLAVDMLNFAVKNAYDTAILVSGDADFADAVRAVKDLGKHVENAYFRRSRAFELLQVCDKPVLLDAKWLEGCFLHRML